MAFSIKTWADRLSEFPNRRKLDSTGIADTYDVTRSEGTITTEGDKFNAAAMNDLESRISDAVDGTLTSKPYPATVTGTTAEVTISGYTVGQIYPITLSATITAATKLSVNGGTAYELDDMTGAAITSIAAGAVIQVYQASATGNFLCLAKGGGTLTGTATAGDVLNGKTFYNTDAKTKQTGAMPENGPLNYTPSASAQSIPAGHTTGGSVAAVSVPVANVLTGTTIAGQTGTYSNIKSIQRGLEQNKNSGSFDIEISAVDLTKAICRITAYIGDAASPSTAAFEAKLTSATNLNISCASSTNRVITYWEVIEFNGVKSLQSGELYSTDATTHNIYINAVNTSKAMAFTSFKNPNTNNSVLEMSIEAWLINSTVLQISGNTEPVYPYTTATYPYTVAWYVVEFN